MPTKSYLTRNIYQSYRIRVSILQQIDPTVT